MNYSEQISTLFPKNTYDTSKEVFSTLLNAIGLQLDNESIQNQKLQNNILPFNADEDGIMLWEKVLGIPADTSISWDLRRKKCIAKIIYSNKPLTKQGLIDILKNYVDDADVIENCSNYSFDVIIKTIDSFGSILNYVFDQIDLIKPAHLSYKIILDYLVNIIMKINFSRYQSEPFQLCGTFKIIDTPYISTGGRRYDDSLKDEINRYFSDLFIRVSQDVYPNGSDGRKYSETVIDGINKYFSEKFIKTSIDTYLYGTSGRNFDELIKDSKLYYFSSILKIASESTYSVFSGLSRSEEITDKCTNYYSKEFLRCSPNLYNEEVYV